mmetsp:Transcript_39626/g.112380  ORF Transcript_39626/g.112380 Transcript_39626/m.112380 type:complete len:95 (+) Transcript_39626:1267-1551(+)
MSKYGFMCDRCSGWLASNQCSGSSITDAPIDAEHPFVRNLTIWNAHLHRATGEVFAIELLPFDEELALAWGWYRSGSLPQRLMAARSLPGLGSQ